MHSFNALPSKNVNIESLGSYFKTLINMKLNFTKVNVRTGFGDVPY